MHKGAVHQTVVAWQSEVGQHGVEESWSLANRQPSRVHTQRSLATAGCTRVADHITRRPGRMPRHWNTSEPPGVANPVCLPLLVSFVRPLPLPGTSSRPGNRKSCSFLVILVDGSSSRPARWSIDRVFGMVRHDGPKNPGGSMNLVTKVIQGVLILDWRWFKFGDWKKILEITDYV